MGDEDDGAIGHLGFDDGADMVRAGRVEMGGGLVEQQDRRRAQERPGQGDFLPLPGGQAACPLGQDGVVAAIQPPDEVIGPRQARRGHDVLSPGAGLPQGDIVGDGRGEQVRVLRDPGDLAQPAIGRNLIESCVANRNGPAGWCGEPEQQGQQRAFPRAAGAGQDDVFARLDGQADAVQSGPVAARVAEGHPPQHDCLTAQVGVGTRGQRSPRPGRTGRQRGIEDLEGPPRGSGTFGAGMELGAGVTQRQKGLGSEEQDQQCRLIVQVTGQ